MVAERTLTVTVNMLFFSQLCDEIDQNEKNSQDMIEEVKKKIPGNISQQVHIVPVKNLNFISFTSSHHKEVPHYRQVVQNNA